MCGIAGLSLSPGLAVTIEQLELLGHNLAHRGPDGSGTFIAGNLGLVHRRLAIVDVAHGHQPFTTSDATLALVANGEIYNHHLLRQRLARHDIACTTNSDCEPPLLNYQQRGLAALDELAGMYSLAIADTATGELILARDPFGIKPLYYLQGAQGLAFASEPRALLALNWQPAEVALPLIPHLIGEHATPDAHTLFTHIQRVLPGERLIVKDGQIVRRSRLAQPLAPRRSPATAAFAQQFEAAVARHLAGEVPMGLFLSGGIDSTALLVACHRLGVSLKTYTAYFAEQPTTQPTPAALVAQHYGMPHQDLCYTPEDFWTDLPTMAACMDDLVLDYAILPSLHLAKQARADGIKVIFSGEGGDEILAGYKRYRLAPWQRLLRQLPNHRRGGWAKIAPYLRMPVRPLPAPHIQATLGDISNLQHLQYQSITANLVNDLLPKLDRSLMHYGLEGRVPFLDDGFAAYAFNLPDNQKIQAGYGKVILRQYLADAGLPHLAWQRKQGFSVPIHRWLATAAPRLNPLWSASPLLKNVLKPGAAATLLAALPHTKKAAEPVFSLTILALWHAIHIEHHPNPASLLAGAAPSLAQPFATAAKTGSAPTKFLQPPSHTHKAFTGLST